MYNTGNRCEISMLRHGRCSTPIRAF